MKNSILTNLKCELDQMVNTNPKAAISKSVKYMGALLNALKEFGMTDSQRNEALQFLLGKLDGAIVESLTDVNEVMVREVEFFKNYMIKLPELKLTDLKVGFKVTYSNGFKVEKGMVKEVDEAFENLVRVVYNCNNDWADFKNYTGQLTYLRDLKLGWDE